ncbi:Uncharacterised protein g2948 [Pycnogonum litorale]
MENIAELSKSSVNIIKKQNKISKRKPLSVLVPSATNQAILVGSNGVIDLTKNKDDKRKKRKSNIDSVTSSPKQRKNTNIYEDLGDDRNKRAKIKSTTDVSCQCNIVSTPKAVDDVTDPTNDELIKWMTGEAEPESCWKALAETRQKTIDSYAKRIEEMDLQNEILEADNEHLRVVAEKNLEENTSLRKAVNEAVTLSNIVKKLTGCDGTVDEDD